MSSSREGPNPLRSYYVPPSIGIPQGNGGPSSSSNGTHGVGIKNGSAASYASSAREIFSFIDYSDYLSESSPGMVESGQKMLNEAFTQNAGVLCGQPFEIAKMVLQVKRHDADGSIPVVEESRARPGNYRDSVYSDYPSDDSDPDEPAYFTSTAPSSHSYVNSRSRGRRRESDGYGSRSPPIPKANLPPEYRLNLKKSDSLIEVISQEWAQEGAWGVWKGSNASFVYLVLQRTVESWSRSLLSAILNVPEPGTLEPGGPIDIIDSPYPWASLGVAVAAGALAGLILAPLDLVRTRLILTPTTAPKRSLLQNLRTLPSYICPSNLLLPTLLHSLIHPIRECSTPMLLRTRLAIDPILTPTTYSLFTFLSRTLEIFIKLPIETSLRRGQVMVLSSTEYNQGNKELKSIVETGPYKGVLGTMWSIVWEEGTRTSIGVEQQGKTTLVRKGKKMEKKGQGLGGLVRGWRVGMWGLVGLYASRAMRGTGNSEGEF